MQEGSKLLSRLVTKISILTNIPIAGNILL